MTTPVAGLVDTHLHLWDTGLLDHPWLAGEPVLGRPHRAAEAAVAVPAARSVVVQADCLPEQGLQEVAWVAEQAAEGRGLSVAAMVAWAPVDGPGLLTHLDALAGQAAAGIPVTGVRRILQGVDAGGADTPALRDGLAVLGRRGLVFDVTVRHDQLGEVDALVRACPGTTFVLDHLGKPPLRRPEQRESWSAALAALAASPNVVLKVSGLGAEADPARPLSEQAGWFVRRGLELFGADRAMIGSDWPVSAQGSGGTWGEWVELVLGHGSAGASPTELAALGHRTAERVYRLGAA